MASPDQDWLNNMAMESGGSVTYTVKELIGMLEKTLTDQMSAIMIRIEELDRKMEHKVSEIRVENLERRVSDNEKRLAVMEITQAGTQAVSGFQRWIIGTVGVGVFGAIVTLIWLAIGGH